SCSDYSERTRSWGQSQSASRLCNRTTLCTFAILLVGFMCGEHARFCVMALHVIASRRGGCIHVAADLSFHTLVRFPDRNCRRYCGFCPTAATTDRRTARRPWFGSVRSRYCRAT